MKSYASKVLAFTGVLGFVCLSCTGCGKMTSEKLMTKMAEAENGKNVTKMNLTVEMDASYNMDIMGANISADMLLSTNGAFLVNAESIGTYADLEMQMDIMDQKMDEQLQSYMVEEDGTLVVYTHSKTGDIWSRTEMADELYDNWMDFMGNNALIDAASIQDMTLDEELAELNGSEVYVVRGNIVSDQDSFMMGFGMMLPDAEDAVSDISVEDLSIPSTIYVDKETYLPVKIEMDCISMESYLNEILNTVLTSGMENLDGEETAFGDLQISLSKCNMTMDGFSYDTQEIPKVPEEAFAAIEFQEALENLDPDLGDGTYAIQSSGAALKVTVPEGWEMVEFSEESITLVESNTMNSVAYTMVPAADEAMYAEGIDTMYTGMLEAAGIEAETGKEEQIISTEFGTADGYWISGGGVHFYYAFIPVKNTYLFLLSSDMSGGERNCGASLEAAMRAVSELTPEDIL